MFILEWFEFIIENSVYIKILLSIIVIIKTYGDQRKFFFKIDTMVKNTLQIIKLNKYKLHWFSNDVKNI